MKLGKLKSFVSLNLMSLVGYLSFAYWLYACAYMMPQFIEYDQINGTDPIAYSLYAMHLVDVFKINCLILALLVTWAIIEFFVRKKYQNLPEVHFHFINEKWHTITFWLGLLSGLAPFCLLFFLLIMQLFA